MNTVLIKKYSNNKLYICKGNTEPVGYTNLEGLVSIIRKGKEVRVIDNKSGEDITVQVLKPALELVEIGLDKLMELVRG